MIGANLDSLSRVATKVDSASRSLGEREMDFKEEDHGTGQRQDGDR